MTKIVDYYFTLISPWAYMGGKRLAEICQRHGAEIRVKPVSYGAIFPKTGGLPLAKRAPERQAYRFTELERWRDFLDIPLNLRPAHFPVPESLAACMVVAAGETGGDPLKLTNAMMSAVWAEERDISDEATLMEIARETGHDETALMARAQDPVTLAAYEHQTEEALEAGVFGAPSYIYNGEIFWGQDRLDFLDRALEG